MKYQATVKDVMNEEVKTVDIDDPVSKAATIMRQFRIGSVLVVGSKHVKGIVTAEDIVYKYVAEKRGEKVSDIMTRDPLTIEPGKKIEEAARLMTEKKIKKLPVMEGGRLVGIITASDIVKVEPALHDLLLEQLKITSPGTPGQPRGTPMHQCEVCGNYTDDVSEVDGVWTCAECDDLTKQR
jgi:signal-transduction protein with cAMP-binding, CBS, and nucleotidyltransferase domain